MRVAVRHPASQGEDGKPVPAHTVAYRLGRVEDHTDPITGESKSAAERTQALLALAQAEHPDCEVVIERLVDNGDGTSRWVKADEVPEGALGPEGNALDHTLSAEQGQDASTGGQS